MADTEMREPTFLVLTALAHGRKHGYALIKEADDLSEGRVKLKVGTLYAALDRLGQQGLVADAGEEVVDGRLRRYYALTDEGADVLEHEITRLESNAVHARARLRVRPVSMQTAGGWA
ncbi:MAG: transcriptional regulator [Leifsonia sp.]|nr:transcriptional regulator [Leifsonia sp.]